ncbi:hypothetical protein ACQ4LE_001748 [Meloidogyne hapla]
MMFFKIFIITLLGFVKCEDKIWRRTPPPIPITSPIPLVNNEDKVCRRTPPPIPITSSPIPLVNNEDKIWRRTPPPIPISSPIPLVKNEDKIRRRTLTPICRTPATLNCEDKIWIRTLTPICRTPAPITSEDNAWRRMDAKETLFRRTPTPKPYIEFSVHKDLALPKHSNFQRKSWYGNWFYWDEKNKIYTSMIYGAPTIPRPTNQSDYSIWEFLEEPPFSSVIDFFKNLF